MHQKVWKELTSVTARLALYHHHLYQLHLYHLWLLWFLMMTERQMLHASSRKTRRRIQGSTGWAAIAQSLGRCRRISSWKPLPAMGRTRKWCGVAQSDRCTKDKSCKTNWLVFYSDMSGCVEKGTAACVVHLDFSKGFDMISHRLLTAKPMRYRLGMQTTEGVEKWLDCQVQRVVMAAWGPSGGQLVVVCLKDWQRNWYSSMPSLMTRMIGWTALLECLQMTPNWGLHSVYWKAGLLFKEDRLEKLADRNNIGFIEQRPMQSWASGHG